MMPLDKLMVLWRLNHVVNMHFRETDKRDILILLSAKFVWGMSYQGSPLYKRASVSDLSNESTFDVSLLLKIRDRVLFLFCFLL